MDVIEHLLRVVRKLTGHIDIHFKVDAENSLELPQCKDDCALGIVNIRNRLLYICLCPHQFELGNFLCVIFLLHFGKVVHRVFIHALIYFEGLFCQKDRKI